MKNIVVLVSGGGTNLQALIDAQKNGEIKNGKISCVISSKAGVYALERAKQNDIKTMVLERSDYSNNLSYSQDLLNLLIQEKADLIVLAGFMTILDELITKYFPYRIINVHPSLIPSFCGKGYYGLKVHKSVLDYGVKVSGATVHFVNEEADAGAIILQGTTQVFKDDTPETLQKRIMENIEWELLPKAVDLFCSEKILIENSKAYILD